MRPRVLSILAWCTSGSVSGFIATAFATAPVARHGPNVNGYDLHVFAPQGNGEFPVIFFVPGVDGDVPVPLYSDLLVRVASKGFIIVGADHQVYPNYPKSGRDFMNVLHWAQHGSNLALQLQKLSIDATPNLDSIAVMGQSEGNHVVGQALAYGCSGAKAVVLIDPVDGVDPYRFVKNQDLIQPGKKLNFTVPALFLDNGLDPKSNFLLPPCMPSGMGTRRWMNAWRGPYWRINATAYGHTDCMDNTSALVGKLLCPSDKRTDKGAYRAMLADMVDAFLGGLFRKRPQEYNKLEDTSHFAVDVQLEKDLKGLAHEQVLPGCSNGGDEHKILV